MSQLYKSLKGTSGIVRCTTARTQVAGNPVRIYKKDWNDNRIKESEHEFNSVLAAANHLGVGSAAVSAACNTGKMITRYGNTILGKWYAEFI